MASRPKSGVVVFLALFLAGDVFAQEPVRPPASLVYWPQISLREFSTLLKGALVKNLPSHFVFDDNHNWGHQAHVLGALVNHGNWEKSKLVARDLQHNLRLRVHGLRSLGDDRLLCNVQVSFPANMEHEKKTWQNGLLVYSGHARARVRLNANFGVDITLHRDETLSKSSIDLKITRARGSSEDFVSENVNGLGGDAAKLIDGGVRHAFNRWEGALTQNVANKIRPAMLKTGSTAEICVASFNLAEEISIEEQLTKALATRIPSGMVLPEPLTSSVDEPACVIVSPSRPQPVLSPVGSLWLEIQLNRNSGGSSQHGGSSRHGGSGSAVSGGSYHGDSSSDHSSSSSHSDSGNSGSSGHSGSAHHK